MVSFWDRDAFSIGSVDFSWADVVYAAMVRGEWSAFERRLAEGLACAARADAENMSPPEEAVDEAATAFRYDRDLIAAADVTAWLDRVALPADEWAEYLRRDLLRCQWSGELEDLLDRFAPSARDLAAAAVTDGICSGAFDAFEQTLAGRAAVVFDTDAAQFQRACQGTAAPVDPLVTRLARTHAHWVSMRSDDGALARLSRAVHLEAAFTAIAERIASNGRLAEIVEDNRLRWMRLEIDTMSFASEAAAREAILCVRVDGLSLYDVAALSRGAVDRKVITLEDAAAEEQQVLLAAEPGSAVGPVAVDGRFGVSLLVSRTPPGLADPVIAARARAAAIDLAQRRAARDHVARCSGGAAA